MKIGIVGLPGCGKTSCFRLITGHGGVDTHHGAHLATVPVPDARLDRIFQLTKPKKMTYADATLVDFEALHKGAAAKGELALHKVAGDVDGFALIIQCFGQLNYLAEPLDPAADLETVLLEMALSDLRIIEGRLERMAKEPKADRNPLERDLLQRCRDWLNQGKALRQMTLSADDLKLLRGYAPLTLMPILVVFNVPEDDPHGMRLGPAKAVAEAAGLAHRSCCVALELEIAQLPAEEQAAFRADYDLEEPAHDQFLKAAFAVLDLISFFTVNENEARAWTVPRGTTALEAAGKIHSDMAAGFIRAETTPFQWLDKLGSMHLCKERGYTRVEGKDYVVQDGDILQIRFSR